MPLYEFLCRDCEHSYEDLVSMDDVGGQTCPDCRSGDVVKLYSPFAVHGSSTGGSDVSASMMGGSCMPGPAGGGGGGGCCGGGCGGCG